MTVAVLSALLRPVADRLPPWMDARFFTSKEEALALAPEAEIGWFDLYDKAAMAEIIAAATRLRWLNSIYAGVDGFHLDELAARGVIFTNGAGINAITIAEYVVMAMLTMAKGYDSVVAARARQEWLDHSPGRKELAGTDALIIGAGAIGSLVATRLAAFDVGVTTVRRTPGDGAIGPQDWRARLPHVDWVVLAVPATPETDAMIGAAELAAMKPDAAIINVARGSVIDQEALVAHLAVARDFHAFLDVTTPEPLPPGHPLWTLPNALVTMHLSGQAQDKMIPRAIARFLENCARWHAGDALLHTVDLRRGY